MPNDQIFNSLEIENISYLETGILIKEYWFDYSEDGKKDCKHWCNKKKNYRENRGT